MRTTNHPRRLVSVFICLFLAMLGMIIGLAVLGDYSLKSLASLLGAGIAASLIASGISGLFALWIIAPQTARSVEETIRATLGHPVHILSERRYLSQDFFMLTESARNIDIISLSLASFVENTPLNSLLRWIAEGKCLRLLVLAPSSGAASQRGREEGINLPNKIKDSIRQFHRICEHAKALIKNHHTFKGSLEVRIFDSLPYFAICAVMALHSWVYIIHTFQVFSLRLSVFKRERVLHSRRLKDTSRSYGMNLAMVGLHPRVGGFV